MCGIVGCISQKGLLERGVFLSMRDSLAHRGPDDAGYWDSLSEGVQMGSRRLAILDLSPRARQPMQDSSGNLTIVFNGEIYNFRELREELRTSYKFRTWSDTEVLLAAYLKWGTDCVEHLNGMFAFAIWDRNRQQLFGARDRFGEKPFYYFRMRHVFLFASEIKALLASKQFQPEANPGAIYRYLAYRETDATEECLLRNVFSLLPAHAFLFSPAQDVLKTWQYWDIDSDAQIRFSDDQAYADRLLELLTDSVRIRLRSDVPVGSSLSGGIDSSTIVGLVAGQINGNRLATFSARFHDPAIDEGQHIQQVADRYRIENHSVYPNPHDLLREIDSFAWHQEHPYAGMSIYAQWCVMKLAKQQGVTVLLDGQGGDESLAGYGHFYGSYYKDMFRQFRWGSLLKTTAAHVRSWGSTNLGSVLVPQLPDFIHLPLVRVSESLSFPREFERNWKSKPSQIGRKFRSSLHQHLYQQLRCSMLPKLLRFADRSSMAFSREVRLPFLDHRLVEYLFAIPSDQKITGMTTKAVLRRAVKGIVPNSIIERTDKKGFETPQAAWLQGPLRVWAEETLLSGEFRHREWVDAKGAQRVWALFLRRPSKYHNLIFRWLSLEAWARVFLKTSQVIERVPSTQQQPCWDSLNTRDPVPRRA